MLKTALQAALAAMLLAAAPGARLHAAEAQMNERTAQALTVIDRATRVLRRAGSIRADVAVESRYPMRSASLIKLTIAPGGRERAEIATTIRQDSFNTLQVIAGGVLWTESMTPTGPLVTKIDLKAVAKALEDRADASAAMPLVGSMSPFDISGLSELVDFDSISAATLDGREVYVISGSLRAELAGRAALPAGLKRFYAPVVLHISAADFLPRRIELGREGNAPLVRFDVTSIETNVALAADTFSYSPPEDADVIDRTDWAISELAGR